MKSLFCACFVLAAFSASFAAEKPRVYISDSKSWEVKAGGGGTAGGFGEAGGGGDRPQTAEIIKTFNERCPQVIVNNNRAKADFVVLLDNEGGTGRHLTGQQGCGVQWRGRRHHEQVDTHPGQRRERCVRGHHAQLERRKGSGPVLAGTGREAGEGGREELNQSSSFSRQSSGFRR